jgi:hypothetical protein
VRVLVTTSRRFQLHQNLSLSPSRTRFKVIDDMTEVMPSQIMRRYAPVAANQTRAWTGEPTEFEEFCDRTSEPRAILDFGILN